MPATILDGKALAAELRGTLAARAAAFREQKGRAPGLHVVLVGDDPASAVYVRNKERAAAEVGFAGVLHRLPGATSEAELLALLATLAADDAVDGILVQLPLPKGIDAEKVLAAVPAAKDVDGFHVTNAGRLFRGEDPGSLLVPCTPLGCMHLLAKAGISPRGKRAVIVGRSAIVGRPMAMLLLAADATVTLAHSRTEGLPALCREADLLVAAVGRAELIRGDWVRPGAVVLDVGINRVAAEGSRLVAGDGGSRLVGDVAFAEVAAVASHLTPVPGGVGPMTIACLLENTLRAAEQRAR